jgi:acetyl esterase/lipase
MKKEKNKVSIGICILVLILSFVVGIVSKGVKPWANEYKVKWNDDIGTIHKDISYGEEESNKFDLYVPKDNSKENYGLVVYLHAGGFTSGDKADDKEMLEWLCSKGYVAVGINYTLRTDTNDKSVYSQSVEIKNAMPVVIDEAKKLGYNINEMAVSGGSAGGALALIYAYRDKDDSPVPVKMVFEAVGPSSFYPEDWTNYGFDKDNEETKKAAAELFGIMAGKEITVDMLGTKSYDEAVKDISALAWIDENTVPTLMAYGKYDKVQPYLASIRLDKKLTEYNVKHDYFVLEHSGHGLQNDDKELRLYYEKIVEYLDKYLSIK